MPRYCRICGKTRPMGLFDRTGDICSDCSKLPRAKQTEMELVTRIRDMVRPLSPAQEKWVKKLLADPREVIRRAEEEALHG